MLTARRRAAAAGSLTFLAYSVAIALFFPAGGQFTKYPQAAALYLSGSLPPERLLDFSPFYFYALVAQQSLLPSATWLPVALQLVAVSIAAGLLLLMLESFFPVWIAVCGTAAFIASRSALVYAAVLEPEVLLLLFVIAFLYFVTSKEAKGQWSAGVALALCISIRPSLLPLFVVVPFFFRINERSTWLASTKRVLLPTLVVLLALSARNGLATGSFSPLGMNPGFVFFEGNNPLSTGKSSVYPPLVEALKSDLGDQPDNPHVSYRLVAERDVGRELTTAEANRYWRGKALSFIADHPGRYLSLLATKAYTTWHGYRWHDVGTAQAFDSRLAEGRIPTFPFAALAACALCGLILSVRERRRGLMIYALLVNQLALMLVMYVSERQRLLILPALVFLGCTMLTFMASTTLSRRAATFGAVALLTLILSLPNHQTREDRHLWSAYDASDRAWRESIRLRETERLTEAARWAARSLAHAPWLEDYSRPARLGFAPDGFAARALTELESAAMEPSTAFDRAQLLIAGRRPAEAETLLRRLLDAGERFDRGQIHSSEPRYFLGRALVLQDRTDQALDELRQALASSPGDPFILAELSALTEEEDYQQLVSRYFGRAESLFLVGMAKLKNDRSALADLAGVVEMLPELWRARIYLAAALGAEGDLENATRLYRVTTEGKQDPAMLEERIVPIFAAVAEASADWSAHYQHGLVLTQFGRFDEALVALRAALAIEPRAEVQQAIVEAERMKVLAGGSG